MTSRFPRTFFERAAVEVAPDLLGALLVTRVRGQITAGMIVEAEAYDGQIDPACHSYRRRTARTEVMYWGGGHCYVYFVYGMHVCANVVTGPKDQSAAVLIRALEPVAGIEVMQRRRPVKDPRLLCNGPAKLCQALAITQTFWGENLMRSKRIWLEPYSSVPPSQIGCSRRIGLSKAQELEWRFFVSGNGFVSKA